MFTHHQYRAKATEYNDRARATHNPAEVREYEALGRSFTTLADNAQWLADNYAHTVHGDEAQRTPSVLEP